MSTSVWYLITPNTRSILIAHSNLSLCDKIFSRTFRSNTIDIFSQTCIIENANFGMSVSSFEYTAFWYLCKFWFATFWFQSMTPTVHTIRLLLHFWFRFVFGVASFWIMMDWTATIIFTHIEVLFHLVHTDIETLRINVWSCEGNSANLINCMK